MCQNLCLRVMLSLFMKWQTFGTNTQSKLDTLYQHYTKIISAETCSISECPYLVPIVLVPSLEFQNCLEKHAHIYHLCLGYCLNNSTSCKLPVYSTSSFIIP